MEKETYSNIFIEIYFDLHLFCLRGAHLYKTWTITYNSSKVIWNNDRKSIQTKKLFIPPLKNDVILAYHWSIKMYTGLPLVIFAVYWPLICHLHHMTTFFYRHYKELIKYLNLLNLIIIAFRTPIHFVKIMIIAGSPGLAGRPAVCSQHERVSLEHRTGEYCPAVGWPVQLRPWSGIK